MENFWEQLNKPVFALAPMAGLTDSAFRQICKSYGADVVYSEMASATALYYNPDETLKLLEFSKKEKPYIVQLFGSDPEHFGQAAELVEKKIKPDGIDINFGCPVKKVLRQGAGAALMDNLELSKKVIKSTLSATKLPISIKARTKSKNIGVLQFLKCINGLDVKAIMIHGRTLNRGFAGSIDYAVIKKARQYFNGIILANGGIMSAEDAWSMLKKTGADGVGIARGALGRPWIFDEAISEKLEAKSMEEIFNIALRHAKLAEKLKGKQGIIEMRKHLCWYVQGMPGARTLRQELVKVKSRDEIRKIAEKFNDGR